MHINHLLSLWALLFDVWFFVFCRYNGSMVKPLSPLLQLDGNLLSSQVLSSNRPHHETKQSQQYHGFSLNFMQDTVWQYKSNSLRANEDGAKPPLTPLKPAKRNPPTSSPSDASKSKRSSKLSNVLHSVIQNTLPEYFSNPYHTSRLRNYTATSNTIYKDT